MNEQSINDIKDSLREVMQLLVQRGEPIPDDLKLMLAQVMEHAANRITELRTVGNVQQSPTPPQPPQPPEEPPTAASSNIEDVDLLWILAGGNEEAFIGYLRTFPNTGFNQLLRNPAQLREVIANLSSRFGEGINLEADGIPHGPLMSSNIYGFQYDQNSGNLKVRFNSGSVYSYDGVPRGVFRAFEQGAVPARTNGENQYGHWWQGKMPSAGAAFYELIRNGGYPYQRVN